jgi:hypothetical protein
VGHSIILHPDGSHASGGIFSGYRYTPDWTEEELQAIVADYFSMLQDELSGRPYSKTEHRNALRETVRRSPGSIELKHQNISAVLQELGLPWINGYKPLGNFQDALADCVEARLGSVVDRLDQFRPLVAEPPVDQSLIFVPPPRPGARPKGRSMAGVSGKFDPAARDAANRVLGRAGEDYIVELERRRLTSIGRKDLAERVTWVADQIELGYDIQSFAGDGSPLFIEVKTTRGGINTPFFVSENERRVAAENGPAFQLYRLFGFGAESRVYCLIGPLETALELEPIAYRARVGGSRN